LTRTGSYESTVATVRGALLLGFCGALLAAGPAGAVDQPLAGKRLMLGGKENKPRKQRVQVLARDTRLSIGDGPSSADDPTIHGGTVRVFSAAGGFDDTYPLPASGWKALSAKDPAKGWKYLRGDPVQKVFVVARKKLQVLGRGPGLGHSLEVDPDPVGIEVTIGARRYCMAFDGETSFRATRRYVAKDAPEPMACGGPVTTTTTVAPTTTTTIGPATSTTTTSSTTSSAPPTSTTTTASQPPEIVSTPPAGDVLLDQTTQAVDLSNWTSVLSTATSSGGNPVWDVAPDGLSVVQTQNSNPGFFLSDFDLVDAVLDGTITVETTSDDDIIGFVFGFQDVNHLYLFDWKQVDQSFCGGFADAGMTVKVVSAATDLACIDLWNTDGQPGRVTNLYHNTIPWADNTTYGFTLDFEPGTIRIVVKEGDTVLDTITVQDATYASGLFGFYNNSQNAVRYTGFTETTVIPGLYVYDVDATDPEGDPITYSLTQAPAGMTIDPTTGQISWAPGGADLGSHDVTVRASAQGGFDEQVFTVVVGLNVP
jgi:hypothetical protein